MAQNPLDDFGFELEISFFVKLHVGDAIFLVGEVATENTFVQIAGVLNKERVADFGRADDVIGVGTSVGIVNAQTEVEAGATLASNARFGIISTIAEDNIFAPTTAGRVVDVL